MGQRCKEYSSEFLAPEPKFQILTYKKLNMLIFSNGKYKNEFFLPFKNQLLKMLTQYMYFLDFFVKNIFAIQNNLFL